MKTRNNLNEKEYFVEDSTQNFKRICFALDLKDDADLITKYLWYHQKENIWKEIVNGINKSGIKVMDIYHVSNRLFMICELDVKATLDVAWEKMGTFERQEEWAELMATFQQALPGFNLEWVKMERVFTLE